MHHAAATPNIVEAITDTAVIATLSRNAYIVYSWNILLKYACTPAEKASLNITMIGNIKINPRKRIVNILHVFFAILLFKFLSPSILSKIKHTQHEQ